MPNKNCKEVAIHDLPLMATAFEEFEREFDTSEFQLGDIWMWPLIRSRIVGKLVYEVPYIPYKGPESSNREQRKSHLSSIGDIGFQIKRSLFHLGWRMRKTGGQEKADVVAITMPRRRKLFQGEYVDPTVDPLMDRLEREGFTVVTVNCDTHSGPTPAHRLPLSLGHILSDAIVSGGLSRKFGKQLTEPAWFVTIRLWAQQRFNFDANWYYFALMYGQIQDMRRVFGRLFSRMQPSLILTSCWYNWPDAAALIAAKDRGIKVCDIQHGMQEHVHPCFHRWSATPPKDAIDPFPSSLWVWGKSVAKLYKNHSLASELFIGGNVFMNDVMASNKRKLTLPDQSKLTIGYSLTWPLQTLMQDLKQTLQSCPHEWRWVFRTHPGDVEGPGLLRTLKAELPHHNIDLESGQRASVIDFLCSVDVHATHESSCALEALALGMPTLITLHRASMNFAPWLQQGVLIAAYEPSSLKSAVAKALKVDPKVCKHASEEVFASPSSCESSLKLIVEYVRRRERNVMSTRS